jgi:hypothetical protein
VTLDEGNFDFSAAGMLPEKAGRTAREVDRLNKCKCKINKLRNSKTVV